MRPTLTAIVTSHRDPPSGILLNLARQTELPTQVLCCSSSLEKPWELPPLPFPVIFSIRRDEGDYGYAKRNSMIPSATSTFTGFFCHDDSYRWDYIEQMLDAVERSGSEVGFCAWNDRPACQFRPGDSTLGNFIVRTDLLHRIGGFPTPSNRALCDAGLIAILSERTTLVVRVPDTLFLHNIPFLSSISPSVEGKRQ